MLDQYISRRYRREVRPSPEAYLIKDRTAIVGIGQTEFSRASGRSTLQVEDVELSMSTAGLGVPTGALILRR